MGYSPELNKGILHPPKCGTHSTQQVAKKMGGWFAPGHMSFKELTDHMRKGGYNWKEAEFAMSVREPVSRLVSAINYNFPRKKFTLNAAMEHIVADPRKIFPEQVWYWAEPVRLFPFDGLPILKWLGWNGPVPHGNPGPATWSREEIVTHSLFHSVIVHYKHDFDLWRRACLSTHS